MRLRGPAELLSALPYLLGFHPTNSLVALGLRGPGLHVQLRGDLPGDETDAVVLADHYGQVFARNGMDGALLIGYGPPERADPFLKLVNAAMVVRGLRVYDLLRTHERRFWSLFCSSPDCCPPEGRPFDPETSVAAAEATLAGLVAMPSRETVAELFEGPVGPALAAIEDAGDRANLRVLRLAEGRDPAGIRAAVVAAGRVALEAALTRYAADEALDDDELAWLQVLLHVLDFRDRAWERLDRDTRCTGNPAIETHRRFWMDMVRRCEPSAVAPAATLLSYLSWRTGNGLHAALALDRAFAADPGYTGAGLMAEILGRGLSPAELPPIGRRQRRTPRGPAPSDLPRSLRLPTSPRGSGSSRAPGPHSRPDPASGPGSRPDSASGPASRLDSISGPSLRPGSVSGPGSASGPATLRDTDVGRRPGPGARPRPGAAGTTLSGPATRRDTDVGRRPGPGARPRPGAAGTTLCSEAAVAADLRAAVDPVAGGNLGSEAASGAHAAATLCSEAAVAAELCAVVDPAVGGDVGARVASGAEVASGAAAFDVEAAPGAEVASRVEVVVLGGVDGEPPQPGPVGSPGGSAEAVADSGGSSGPSGASAAVGGTGRPARAGRRRRR
ncbi:hypothetical protein GCM10018962_09520 [Dactylosporangium matsuzakiense]|uniref:DUF4192 domain-containing protein n=1 Tax=Dactylosporangium matsuzakiense TaxID=53360 RepID=A0A9W6NIL3_9ACTN|nr:hypothetical protein GCM10017581_007000 [Dactylosporangium matsuzakiense]